jgi:hypothetical protein
MSKRLLKTDFHLHTREDPHDFIAHDAYRLVDIMVARGYDAIGITNHDKFTWSERLRDYAHERGLIMFRSVERTIDGRHALLINFPGELEDYRTLGDVQKAKRPDNLVIAAHPFFPIPTASGKLLDDNPDAFDALEYCHYYIRNVNFNKKAVACSYQINKPLVGNSDAHTLRQLGRTCSLVEADEKSPEAIIDAIKRGKVEVMTRPFRASTLIRISCVIPYRNVKGRIKCMMRTGRYGNRGQEPDFR